MHPVIICFTLFAMTFSANGADRPFWIGEEPSPSDDFSSEGPKDFNEPAPADQGGQTFHSPPPGCQCPATAQFNPVCGSDNNTYRNLEILNCFVECGASRTSVQYAGSCRRSGR